MKSIIDTELKGFKLRFAEQNDVSLILEFIRELAEYEKNCMKLQQQKRF